MGELSLAGCLGKAGFVLGVRGKKLDNQKDWGGERGRDHASGVTVEVGVPRPSGSCGVWRDKAVRRHQRPLILGQCVWDRLLGERTEQGQCLGRWL